VPQIQGVVSNPAAGASLADGSNTQTFLQGKAGELIAAELHGQYYSGSYRGAVQYVTTLTAGTTIPIQAASLASTFTIWNPAGSGKNLELITYSAVFQAATTVVSDVSLYWQAVLANPTALTALTIRNGLLGAGLASVATAYSVATLVGALTIGPTLFGPNTTQSVAGGSNGPAIYRYDFLGTIIVPPNTIITTAGNAAQSQATKQTLIWAEWPV
jgi:hypothetical protein